MPRRQVIGYLPLWGPDLTNKIDPTLCTIYILPFADLNASGAINVPATIGNFSNLKSNAKLLLSIGGDGNYCSAWKNIAGNASIRETFALNCLKICQQYGLNGVDIDWEFPDTGDRGSFVALHQAIYEKLNPNGLILTTAVSAGNWLVNTNQVYDIPALSKYVYGFNLMTYDMHMDEAWDVASGVNFNAPKFSNAGDSIDQGIRSYLNKGAPASKIFMGVPFYSRKYLLRDASLTKPGSPFEIGYQRVEMNKETYSEYCAKLKDPSWTKMRSSYEASPYMFREREWMSYEDVESIKSKCELANKYNLGGVMVWSINQDDIDGRSGVKQPLLKAVNAVV